MFVELRKELPLLVRSSEELAALETTGKVISGMLTTSFVIPFVAQIFTNKAMK